MIVMWIFSLEMTTRSWVLVFRWKKHDSQFDDEVCGCLVQRKEGRSCSDMTPKWVRKKKRSFMIHLHFSIIISCGLLDDVGLLAWSFIRMARWGQSSSRFSSNLQWTRLWSACSRRCRRFGWICRERISLKKGGKVMRVMQVNVFQRLETLVSRDLDLRQPLWVTMVVFSKQANWWTHLADTLSCPFF